jgi:protein tyrosine phosphatase (PTP) superfamily phosphohydrolase (DUF442 family)
METKRITDIPGLMQLWKVDNLLCAGQPSLDSFAPLKEMGIKKVYNMRGESEMDFSEEIKQCKSLGLEYIQFPLVIDGALSKEACSKLSSSINEDDLFLIHCGSANRIGGWLITHLVSHKNMEFDAAVEVAMNNGLTNPTFIEQAREILEN